MPQVILSTNEFIHAHGGHPVRVRDLLLLPDGATVLDWGQQCAPPRDDRERLTLQAEYANEQLRRTESDFHAIKSALTGQSPPIHSSALNTKDLPTDGLEALRKLQGMVRAQRAAVERIGAQLAEHCEDEAQPDVPNIRAELEAEAAELRRLAEAIEI